MARDLLQKQPVDLLEKPRGRDLLEEPQGSPLDYLTGGVQTAISAAKQTIPKYPFVGMMPSQVAEGAKTVNEVLRRPLAGLTALSVETPFADEEKSVS